MTTDSPMTLGVVGLGRMGANIARRLMRDGHSTVVHDVDPAAVATLVAEGAIGAESLDALAALLPAPRAVWVMVPAGRITQETIAAVAEHLDSGDVIIDGGNTYYRDDLRHAATLRERGIDHVDCGTSGGVFGARARLLPDDRRRAGAVERLDPIFASLAPGVEAAQRTPGRSGPAGDGRAGLPALRPERCRPLREDGPQRDRVRDHGRLRRGPEHPRQRRRRASGLARGGRRDGAAGAPRVLPVRARPRRRSPRSGGAAAWSAPGCST